MFLQAPFEYLTKMNCIFLYEHFFRIWDKVWIRHYERKDGATYDNGVSTFVVQLLCQLFHGGGEVRVSQQTEGFCECLVVLLHQLVVPVD